MFIANDALPVCQVPGTDSTRAVRAAVVAGYTGDEASARSALGSTTPAVRAAGWGALARMGALRADELAGAFADPAPEVRRRACELAGRLGESPLGHPLLSALVGALADSSPAVVEAACSALGEYLERLAGFQAIAEALAATATAHPDDRCREAAVAALGALGAAGAVSEVALAAITECLGGKPAVRRRAVAALSAFSGPQAAQALERASRDRDWQVRELALELLESRQGGSAHEQATH